MQEENTQSRTAQTPKDILRFITAGSVDDGKSTLIGRLLFDSRSLLSDQIASLYSGKYKRTAEGVPDFAQLTDGLAAEREQGITIDVAYRYFATAARKFIIADTPGHEQYTRNMVTGASTADAAVLLIDASRLDFSAPVPELLVQTKRHSALLKMLGTRHIVVAVNKLDLLDYREDVFRAIQAAYQNLAGTIGLKNVQYVPICALNGDNIVQKSAYMPWYAGEPLLTVLENLPSGHGNRSLAAADALFPVQRVARQDGSAADAFRGYQGTLAQGSLNVGDAVRIEPSGRRSRIQEIYGLSGSLKTAVAGDALTLVLADDVDVSRGDMLVADAAFYRPSRTLTASLCWFGETPLNPARRYLLKHTTRTVFAKIRSVDFLWDVETLSSTSAAQTLAQNGIARVRLALQSPIVPTTYAANPATGAFILIDEGSGQTVAAGMILSAADWENTSENWVI